MKKKINFLWILALCLAVAVASVLCRKTFFPSPKEVAKMKLDQMFQENSKKSEMDRAEAAALLMSKIQETQLACALTEPEDHTDKFFENIVTGLQKVKYEVSEISVSDDEAEVSIMIDHFKLQEITEDSKNVFQDYLQENDPPSQKEMVEKLYEIIANEFQKGPSDSSKIRVTAFLHKKDHKWEVDEKFYDEILDAVLQQ